jgi:hypothetical protein
LPFTFEVHFGTSGNAVGFQQFSKSVSEERRYFGKLLIVLGAKLMDVTNDLELLFVLGFMLF